MFEAVDVVPQPGQGLSDVLYIFISGIFLVLVEGFRRYLFGRIENRLEQERRMGEEERRR